MRTLIEIVPDELLSRAFENTDFGGADHRDLIKQGLLKKVCGYGCGKTLHMILIEIGLLTDQITFKQSTLTDDGREYLYVAYNIGRL
jgi:hypothetical protein